MPEHIGRQENKSLSGVKHGKCAECNKKYFSSKENTDPWKKNTKKPHQGIKHLLGWESVLSDLPEGRGRVYAA